MKADRLDPSTFRPDAGERFSFQPARMHAFDVVIDHVGPGEVLLLWGAPGAPAGPGGVTVPASSVAHFVNDLQGQVVVPLGPDPLVNAVIRGEAEFLGKGDDGLVFRVGDNAVKVSTTVPYQPFNQHHLTPEEAVKRLARQQWTSEAMRRAGVPGMLPSRFVVQGDKGFMIRPYVEIGPLSGAQLQSVADAVHKAHSLGWAFRDAIQVGHHGEDLFHFDTGKAERIDAHDGGAFSAIAADEAALRALFSEHGFVYVSPAERENPVEEFENALWHTTPDGMSDEALREHRRLLLQLRTKLESFMRKHPGHPTTEFWGDRDFRADEFKKAMNRFGWAPRQN